MKHVIQQGYGSHLNSRAAEQWHQHRRGLISHDQIQAPFGGGTHVWRIGFLGSSFHDLTTCAHGLES